MTTFTIEMAERAFRERDELRAEIERLQAESDISDGLLADAKAEIERLREEVETWRSRYEAERRDHEATMKAWDEERSGL